MLVGSIERSFDIKFDLMEMVEMKSIGDIARATYEAIR
jgi:acyl carrier protein